MKATTYLLGETPLAEGSYKVIFCLLTLLGAVMQLDAVVAFSNAMIFAMSLPNVIGLYILASEVKRALAVYWAQLASGETRSRRAVPVKV